MFPPFKSLKIKAVRVATSQKKNVYFLKSHTIVSLPSKAGVLSAVTSAQLLQHHSPPPLPPYFFFPLLRFTGRVFTLVHGLHSCKKKKQKKNKPSRGGINKNVLAVTRDLSGNEGPGGRRQRGENACSGVELDISVSCQRLVHGCGMLMSEVSLSIFFSLSLSLPPSSCPPPSLSLSRSLWEEEEKKRIDS